MTAWTLLLVATATPGHACWNLHAHEEHRAGGPLEEEDVAAAVRICLAGHQVGRREERKAGAILLGTASWARACAGGAGKMEYPVMLESDETGGFVVYCPTLKGCVSQGETEEEALENIRDAHRDIPPEPRRPQAPHDAGCGVEPDHAHLIGAERAPA